MRSGTIPNWIHHTAGRDNPATAPEANRAPLVFALEYRYGRSEGQPCVAGRLLGDFIFSFARD